MYKRQKEDSPQAIRELQNMGIHVVMLTGDNARTAEAIGRQAGVNEVIAGVLPDGKENVIRKLREQGEVMMVGDGINDAPALTRADIGVAIGAGTDIAIDAADVVLMKSRLSDVPAGIRLSRATLRNIHENLFWAFIYNIIGIPLAAGVFINLLGWQLNPMFGAAAMSLSSFCVVTNALRLNLLNIRSTKHDKKIKSAKPAEMKTIEVKETKTMEKTIKINGMMCPHCEATVKKCLEAFPQVTSAEVSHEKGTAVIQLNAEISDAELKKAIEENVGIDYGRAKTYTVGNWLEVWYENYAKIKMRPSTYLTYHGYIENHIKPQLGKIPLNDLTTLHLQQFYKKLLAEGRVERIEAQKQPKGLSAKTVRNIHQIISSALKLAVEQRLIAHNPADGCALPKAERKEMQTLPVEQLTSFLREAKDSGVFALYYIDLTTGLRRGELLGLKWSDIDLEKGDLRVQRQIGRIDGKIIEMPLKTKNAYRTLPLSADAISVLMQQRRKTGNSEWVFPSPTGGPMSPDSVLHMLHRILKRAGLPKVRFHDLRHPYVKHTTKIFSLRLMDFQAQAYPDARRKTRGACQLLRGGQSQSPVRPLCNRKRFS